MESVLNCSEAVTILLDSNLEESPFSLG